MEERKKATGAAHLNRNYDKDTNILHQGQIVYRSFLKKPKTMLSVAMETGIFRANICRYVAEMEEKGLIQLIYRAEDPIAQRVAGYYSTNKEYFKETKK